jgi:uncharacterized caspase-like protein
MVRLWTYFLASVLLIFSGQARAGFTADPLQSKEACASTYQTKNRALLVGAHAYKHLGAGHQLLGPQNDVRLIENALKPLGFDVQVLTDGTATKETVLASWNSIVNDAKCGDQVFLMLSGHGNRSANASWLYLFEDVRHSTVGVESPEDGVWSDAELYASITQLRARKANVSILLDAPESERARLFSAPHAEQALTSEKWDVVPDEYGALTVLYSHGISPEMSLPAGRPGRRPYGLLSYLVGQALLSNVRSVRELVTNINERWTPVSGDNRRLKANFASTHPDLPLFHSGIAVQVNGAEVLINSSDGRTTRGGARVTGTQLTGQVKPAAGLLTLEIGGRRVADVQPDGRFSVEVPLRRGDNEVEVAAMYTNRPHMVTRMTIHSTGGQWQAERPAQSYALLIAIENYDRAASGFDPLKTPIADANELAKVLSDRYGFRTSITDATGKVVSLMLQNATRNEIFRATAALARVATTNDNVVIFYAGHGARYKSETSQGRTQTYWVPAGTLSDDSTAGYVSAMDLDDQIARIRARHVLLISDSCYAGGLSRSGDESITLQKAEPDRYLSEMSRKPSRYLLASGGDHPVEDGQGGSHSPFAQELLNVLRSPPGPTFTLQQVFPELQRRVSNSSNQTPEFPRLRGDASAGEDGGAMVFFRN